jgi:Calcineurin-like phosphoesterase
VSRSRSWVASPLIASANVLLVMLAATVVATLWDLETASTPMIIRAEEFHVGDVSVRLEEAGIVASDESRLWIRALGLQPKVVVEWRGSGNHRRFDVRIENLNLRAGRLTLSPNTEERARRGTTLDLAASLEEGPLEASLAIPPEVLSNGRFAVVGCTRSNRLIAPILRSFAADAPLFVIHLGDVGQGGAYESEALRIAFDELGIPLFVAPGNHDRDPVAPKALSNFHRYLNPAPLAFLLAGQRFVILDVSDYPIAPAQLAALKGLAPAAREWFFLHRSPIDPFGTDRALPRDSRVGELAKIVESAGDARTYAGHIQGFAETTFASHPFVLSSGGGEPVKELPDGFRAPDPYHYLLVPLDGGAPTRRPLPEPSWLPGIASRASIELPVFARHLGSGIAAAALFASWAWWWRRPLADSGPT